MNIKEIEELSGLPSSGIRYYEAEGLLEPLRLPSSAMPSPVVSTFGATS